MSKETLPAVLALTVTKPQDDRGYGRHAIDELVRHVRSRPHATRLLTSCIRGDGSPLPFYPRVGFSETGREVHGELELVMDLAQELS